MKTLLLLLTAAGLSGCAVYPGPGYEQPYYGSVGTPVYPSYPAYSSYPYVVEPPVYIQGGGVYRSYDAPRYYRAPPVRVVPPVVHRAPRPGWGGGDRDHDGIPNRLDRDRNNDGVPDRAQHRGDRNGNGIPDVAEQRRENIEIPNLIDRRPSGPGRK